MSIFSRASDIIQANINALLDKAEDPEKLLKLIINEMQDSLIELRSIAAKHLAEEKGVSRKVCTCGCSSESTGPPAIMLKLCLVCNSKLVMYTTARVLFTLEQGKHVEAEPLYARSLSVLEKALGPEHLDVGRTLAKWANSLHNQVRSSRPR